jgi:hypothetical protein
VHDTVWLIGKPKYFTTTTMSGALLGARIEDGVRMWDTGMTLVETAKKLGVSFYHYLQDRLSGAMQMPSLANLIRTYAVDSICGTIPI